MFTRITSDLLSNNLLAALSQTEQSQNDALTAVETQQKVNVPSDDPAAASLFASTSGASAQVSQYLQNINSLSGGLQVGDSALASAVSLLTRAVTLGVNGGNGTLSLSQQQDLGQEVGQIQEQMIAIANTTFQGQYIFSGTANVPAYVANGANPDGVTYQGNGGVNQVEIAPGAQTPVNVPGSQIFQNGSGSIFQAINDLKNALNTGNTNGAQTAVSEVNTALNQLSQQRVFYGTTLTRLTSTTTFLNNEQLNLTKQQQSLVGADMATSLTNLSSAETARNAILAAASRISQISLLNVGQPGVGG